MDVLVDLVAVLSMPGIACVVVGQGVIIGLLPLTLLVGMIDPGGLPR